MVGKGVLQESCEGIRDCSDTTRDVVSLSALN